MKKINYLITGILIFSLTSFIGCAQELSIEDFLKNQYKDNKAGVNISVGPKDGKSDYSISQYYSFGMANNEKSTKMNADMIFPIGSITKSYTATAIMILVEQGKISLDDQLSKFYKEIKPEYADIEIKYLLSNTSGILSYNRMKEYQEIEDKSALSIGEMVKVSLSGEKRFNKGERFDYSNSNYILLTDIIEKVSGKTYNKFIQENILDKIDLKDTYFQFTEKLNIPKGYEYTRDGLVQASENVHHTYGAGMILASIKDVNTFMYSLVNGKIISKENVDYLFSVQLEMKDGRPDQYANGFWVTNIEGMKVIKMEGYTPGYFTNYFYIPEIDLHVGIFPNTSGFPRPDDPAYITRWITRKIIGKPVYIWKPANVKVDILKNYDGVYELSEGQYRDVMVKDGILYTMRTGGQTLEAKAINDHSFYYPGTFTHFRFEKLNGEYKMIMTDDENNVSEAIKTDKELRKPIQVDVEILKKYVGKYERRFEILLEGDKLMFTNGFHKYELFAKSETEFFPWHEDANWIFNNNEDNVMELTYKIGEFQMKVKRIE